MDNHELARWNVIYNEKIASSQKISDLLEVSHGLVSNHIKTLNDFFEEKDLLKISYTLIDIETEKNLEEYNLFTRKILTYEPTDNYIEKATALSLYFFFQEESVECLSLDIYLQRLIDLQPKFNLMSYQEHEIHDILNIVAKLDYFNANPDLYDEICLCYLNELEVEVFKKTRIDKKDKFQNVLFTMMALSSRDHNRIPDLAKSILTIFCKNKDASIIGFLDWNIEIFSKNQPDLKVAQKFLSGVESLKQLFIPKTFEDDKITPVLFEATCNILLTSILKAIKNQKFYSGCNFSYEDFEMLNNSDHSSKPSL